MKNEKEIYTLKNKINESKLYLYLKLRALEKQEEELQNACNHSIVFKIPDIRPHKIGEIDLFFCPACSKIIKQFNNEINDLAFANSQIIELKGTDILLNQDIYETIQNETISNYDFYYDENILPSFKEQTMNKVIIGKVLKKDIK